MLNEAPVIVIDRDVLRYMESCFEEFENIHRIAKQAYKERPTETNIKDGDYKGLIWKRNCKVMHYVYYLRSLINVRERHPSATYSHKWDEKFALRAVKSLFEPSYTEPIMSYLKGE